MNTNLIHNIINIAIAVIAALSVPEVGNLLPPDWALWSVGALSTAKMIMNVVRDGLTGLVKEQPPVK